MSWVDKEIDSDSTLINNSHDEQNSGDNAPWHENPIANKLADIMNEAHKRNPSETFKIETGKSKTELTEEDLRRPTSVDETKQMFDFWHCKNQFVLTCCLQTKPISLHWFKRRLMKWLGEEKIFIHTHKEEMDQLSSTSIGWFCCSHHPDASPNNLVTEDLNHQIREQHEKDPTRCEQHPQDDRDCDANNWDPHKHFPKVTTKPTKIKWRPQPRVGWTATTTGVCVRPQHKLFVKKLLIDSNQEHMGRLTFVDMALQCGDEKVREEHSKSVSPCSKNAWEKQMFIKQATFTPQTWTH